MSKLEKEGRNCHFLNLFKSQNDKIANRTLLLQLKEGKTGKKKEPVAMENSFLEREA